MIEKGEREPILPEYRILRSRPGEVYVVEHRRLDWRRIFGWTRHQRDSFDCDCDHEFESIEAAEKHIDECRQYEATLWLRKRYYPKVVKHPA